MASRLCALFLVWLATGLYGGISDAQAGNRLALLIGNKNYRLDALDLANPHNDVGLVAAALRSAGFEVIIERDAGFGKLQRIVKRYARRLSELGPDAVGFFYYSGHGALNPRNRSNYLIPVDVDTTENRGLWDGSVRLKRIIDELKAEASEAVHFVVFDACRNELKLTDRKSKSLVRPKGFQPLRTVRGMLIAYSTAEGDTASDVGKGAGPYARALARAIASPGIEAVQMFRNIQLDVHREIGQEPWFTFGALKKVYLSGRASPGRDASQHPAFAAWERVKASTSKTVLAAFRKRYGSQFPVLDALAAERLALLGGRQASNQTANLTPPAPAPVRPSTPARGRFISIGTGGVTGVYYPAGGAVCRLVNKGRGHHGIRCSAESTGGSIYNINSVRAGQLEFGVAQSDWHYLAYHGTSKFRDKGPFRKLRSVFSLHAEPVTMVASIDSGIQNITDLKGKRVNIGNPGSGTLGTWEVIEAALGWKRADLGFAAQLRSYETTIALCSNKIDAFFWLVGHPSALTQEATSGCPTQLVNVTSPALDRLVAANPYYRKAIIPAGMYNNRSDVNTFGVGATMITSSDVSEKIVYHLVKSVFDDLETFRRLHPAFKYLKREEMVRDSLSAPLHRGAARFYREHGWIN